MFLSWKKMFFCIKNYSAKTCIPQTFSFSSNDVFGSWTNHFSETWGNHTFFVDCCCSTLLYSTRCAAIVVGAAFSFEAGVVDTVEACSSRGGHG